MSEPIDLDAIQALYDAGDAAARNTVPALVRELREARAKLAKLPHHCESKACKVRAYPNHKLCGCNCDDCEAAEELSIYAHKEATANPARKHCGVMHCLSPMEPGGLECDCNCVDCVDAEDQGIYVHGGG